MVKRNFFGAYKGIELTTNGCEGNHSHFTGIEMDYKKGEVKISYCMFCWYLWYLMDRMLWTVVCYSNTNIWYVGITSYLRSFIVIYIYMSIINQPFWGSPILGNQPIFRHDGTRDISVPWGISRPIELGGPSYGPSNLLCHDVPWWHWGPNMTF